MRRFFCCILIGFGATTALRANSPEGVEWFESRIRPILAQECYECHSEATKSKGGLLLDTRKGWQQGGDSGAVIVPGKPEDSLLLKSLRHEIEDLKMPKAGAQLDANVLHDFKEWIAMGAPDPRDEPPSQDQLERDTNWEAIRERRKQWWSFQPIIRPEMPASVDALHPVDVWIQQGLEEAGLRPSPKADPRTLHRRLRYTLTGLPPSVEEADQFLEDWKGNPDTATEKLIDRLLDDPAFGERWARHWMDWLRYADSHGSEGDPMIPFAWQYRDYLIRAWNEDVPYDQLLREHIAGDLLAEPRINEELGINESAIGPAHFRMVFHGFAPTDALDERVRFTDDQINTVTKAFLGLTVSCARCHDHKFDAISQADYYALFGIFTSSLPATVAIDSPGKLEVHREELARLKLRIRKQLAEEWGGEISKGLPKAMQANSGVGTFLKELRVAESRSGGVAQFWKQQRDQLMRESEEAEAVRADNEVTKKVWDLTRAGELENWTFVGEGQDDSPVSEAGDFLLDRGKEVIARILPSGTYSSLLSEKHRGFLASAPQYLDDEYTLYLHVAGEASSARFAVQHYPRRGTVYPITALEKGDWKWIKYDRIDYWKGDEIHIELATAREAPIRVGNQPRSWFGIREAVLVKKGSPSPKGPDREWMMPIVNSPVPDSYDSALSRLQEVASALLGKWGRGLSLQDSEALFLDQLVQSGIVSNTVGQLSAELQEAVNAYRDLEEAIPVPTLAPGLVERIGRDWPLHERGNHMEPGELIPRRFLEAIDETPYKTSGSGRLEFAADLLREDNPFAARVIVNRVWHHLFGTGLVTSADNFGRLGEKPSHPELLDYLADRFRKEQAWSLKELIRDLVSTQTFQQSSLPSEEALTRDPDNRLLSHFSLRRIEAEAIRDSILDLSGYLTKTRFGPSVQRDESRRSIYAMVRRNDLEPLLTTFDFPTPASTVGRRSITNVPAQSLTLLNDPGIIRAADRWAGKMINELPAQASEQDRIAFLFREALNRDPSEKELASAASFLTQFDSESRSLASELQSRRERVSQLQKKRHEILAPIRSALLGKKKEAQAGKESAELLSDPGMIAKWDFSEGLADEVEGYEAILQGTARRVAEGILFDGNGFAATPPLKDPVGPRTMEALVLLDTLEQRGGGVMTIQDLEGRHFDSIVFAERKSARWLAGSNNHARTLDFEGEDEVEAISTPVRIVLTYRADGTISCYRNGVPWGKPIRKGELQTFDAGASQLVFGLRHGTGVSGNRTLRGTLLEAALYDRALGADEIKALASGDPLFVTSRELQEAMSDGQRESIRVIELEEKELKKEIDRLVKQGAEVSEVRRRWTGLCHAILNLKEFIYLQ